MNTKNMIKTVLLCGLSANVLAKPLIGINANASGDSTNLMNVSSLSQKESVHFIDNSQLSAMKLPAELNKQLVFALESQKKLGYVPRKSDDAKHLLGVRKEGFKFRGDDKYLNSTDKEDTHLKKSLSQIKLAFEYRPLSFIPANKTIGYAPAMTYKENGWTGIVQFFNYNEIGICKYFKSSVILNNSAIYLSKKNNDQFINGKPARVLNEGTEKEGFAYQVHWYDNQYFHELTCANEMFSKESAKQMISLATLIDNE